MDATQEMIFISLNSFHGPMRRERGRGGEEKRLRGGCRSNKELSALGITSANACSHFARLYNSDEIVP